MTNKQIGIRIALLVLIIAAPILVFAVLLWPGVIGVALFGVLVSTFAWISGGPRVSIIVTVALAVLGVVGILCRDHTWLLALIVFLLGVGYGIMASRGIGGAFLQLPILAPYFMMTPPSLFSGDPPEITAGYLLAIAVVVIIAGLWTLLVLNKVAPNRPLKVIAVPDPRLPIIYGVILGIASAVVVVVARTYLPNSHWVWVTLTLYVLANPTDLMDWKKFWHRLLGTFAGFVAVTLLVLIHVPDDALMVLAIATLWACLFFFVTKKPYWQYCAFLTMTVVLVDSYGVSTVIMDGERIGFTIVGAVLAIIVAFLVNAVLYRQMRISKPQDARL